MARPSKPLPPFSEVQQRLLLNSVSISKKTKIRHWTTTARVRAAEANVDLAKGHTWSSMRNEVNTPGPQPQHGMLLRPRTPKNVTERV
jgi:hypothetical protein